MALPFFLIEKSTGLLQSATWLWRNKRKMDVVLTKLYEIFTAQILDIGGAKFSIASIAMLLGLIVLAFFVSKLVSEILRRSLLTRFRINRGLQEAITIFIKYVLITISSVIILQTAGINLSSLAVIAGVVGIGIGFGRRPPHPHATRAGHQ